MRSRDSDIDTRLTIPATDWYPTLTAAGLRNAAVHGRARHWLRVEGSFTQALRQQCAGRLSVDVRRQGFTPPTPEEARRLRIPPRQTAWIREVNLCGEGQPWVLARTVVPLSCLKGRGRRLLHLGNRPLGAHLFTSPHWQRGPLETGLCRPTAAGQPELARRSMFSSGNRALLVGEYLLPALLQATRL